MLVLTAIALLSSSCKTSHTDIRNPKAEAQAPLSPPLSELLKQAEIFWQQHKLDRRNQTVEEAYKLYRSDPFWRRTEPLPAYLQGTRAEVINLWMRGDRDPKNRSVLLAEARRVSQSIHSDELVAKSDYRIADTLFRAGRFDKAGMLYESAAAYFRKVDDPSWLAKSLVSLSAVRIKFDRHDETIAMCLDASESLKRAPDPVIGARLENNLGWSYLQLGKGPEALDHLKRSAVLYRKLADSTGDEVTVLRNIAAYHVRAGSFADAEEALRRANEAAVNLPDDRRAPVLSDLAEVYALDRQWDLARENITKARNFSKFKGQIATQDDAHIVFVDSVIADERNDPTAEAGYRKVVDSRVAWSSLRLEAALKRARWLAAHKRGDEAEAQYRAAEALLEGMRQSLDQDESKLSFFEEAGSVYSDYVDLLVTRHKDREALEVADRSRARLLSDYQNPGLKPLDLAKVQARLKTVDGIALFYWIGDERAYLWMIGADSFERVTLNAAPADIRRWAQTYFEAVASPAELPPTALEVGEHLRDTLLAPAKNHLTRDRRVFMVLDDQLGLLNPESLPGTSSKWWIDEAIVSVVPTLALLERPRRITEPASMLLAMGDAADSPGYPKLTYASLELDAIQRLFPPDRRRVIVGKDATPSQYSLANPIQFAMIHFTAHGKAEAGNPLDSAVILSKDPRTQAFKLYAREIVRVRIEARLVTISACKSAGSRTYRGEGAVGLAWAFLNAGAEQVVAGLWNIHDQAGQDLMTKFYEGMRKRNLSPAVALREAKQELIKSYKKPYYWAPFEIFAGYVEP
jgi:CHAT domain-containing protein